MPGNVGHGQSRRPVAARSSQPTPVGAKPAASRREAAWVVGLTLAALAPFLGKPFHVDDPLFLRAAEQILREPWDFFGCEVAWYAAPQPLYEVTKNPPLAAYWLALGALFFGWNEVGLHVWFLVPAAFAAWGGYQLAARFCARPAIAALAGLMTPAFVASSTSVMCDTMMLAGWVWACVYWWRGLDTGLPRNFALAALLIACAALTKYFGVALIPLLVATTLIHRRRFDRALLWLLLPVLLLAAYELYTRALYGQGMLFEAALYARAERVVERIPLNLYVLIALTYPAGCVASTLAMVGCAWSRRTALTWGAVLFALIAATLAGWQTGLWSAHGAVTMAHLIVFGVAALHLFAVTLLALRRDRGAETWFLVLWLAGTVYFTCAVNWTINARSMLAAAPAIGILIARQIDRRVAIQSSDAAGARRLAYVGLAVGAVLSLVVAWGDAATAAAFRSAAVTIGQNHGWPQRALWFDAHWGFQWYLEQQHAKHLGHCRDKLRPGDRVVFAEGSLERYVSLPQLGLREVDRRVEAMLAPASTLCRPANVNFYGLALVPYLLHIPPPEPFQVLEVTREIPAEWFQSQQAEPATSAP